MREIRSAQDVEKAILWHRFIGELLLAVLIIMVVPFFAFAQSPASLEDSGKVPVAPVGNACSRPGPGSVIEQPSALFSNRGVLAARFSWQTVTDFAGRTLYCFMTPEGAENPTLHLRPGDDLIITITNNVPALGFMMSVDSPNCGPGGREMTFSSVNIHYHGTNTSPLCGSDEVIKTLINSGQTFQYHVKIPRDEPPGLYWYHPHVHGISEGALLGGGSGAIVIDGIENIQPEVANLRQRVLIIRDQPTVQAQDGVEESAGGVPNGVPMQDITVNNISTNATTDTTSDPPTTTYTPAVLHMDRGETEFWRVSNSCADTILDLQVRFDGLAQPLRLVAIDGVTVNSQDGAQPGGLITVSHFRLPPGARVEFLVRSPEPKVGSAELVTQNVETGPVGDDDPNRPLFDIVVASRDDGQAAPGDRTESFSGLSAGQKRFAGLAQAAIAARRTLYFNENATQFFMDVEGTPEHVFDPNAPPAITATQGTVEEWVVQNRTLENHEFHLHQVHFLVELQDNFAINSNPRSGAVTGQYVDTIEVPHWDGNPAHPYPSVTLRVDFRGPDVGDFVFHCHILEHEDGGMMNIVRVVQPGSPEKNLGAIASSTMGTMNMR